MVSACNISLDDGAGREHVRLASFDVTRCDMDAPVSRHSCVRIPNREKPHSRERPGGEMVS